MHTKKRCVTAWRLFVCKEILYNEYLSNSKSEYKECLHDWPPHNSSVQILCSLPSFCFIESIMSLGVNDWVQGFMDNGSRLFHLRHGCEMISCSWKRCFVSYLKVEVHQFVSKCWKFIWETNGVDPCVFRSPSISVKLLLDSLIDNLVSRITHMDVHIILSTTYNLRKESTTSTTNKPRQWQSSYLILQCRLRPLFDLLVITWLCSIG